MKDNLWLRIPASDYEAHMQAVGQDRALREIFSRVITEVRPARVVVLGCTTGADLGLLDPAITELAVGVDVNSEYLEIARARLPALGGRLHLVSADVAVAELPGGPYDLVHAALLLEHVVPESLFARVAGWLGPAGTFSLVIQEPVAGHPAVTDTGFESLSLLATHMILRPAGEVVSLAAEAGLAPIQRQVVRLPSGKRLTGLRFEKARPPLERRRGKARC